MRRWLAGGIAVSFLVTAVPHAAAEVSTDEERLKALLTASLGAYESVNNYRATFLKQEESEGKLGEQETIFLKFEKPFKIFMHWLDTDKKGLQVLYERGRHDGKLAIHKPGLLLGLAPVVFLEQDSPWVREGSESYDIEDAGIGTFLTDYSQMVEKGAKEGTLRAQVEENEAGYVVDTIFENTSPDTGYFAYRVWVFFDKLNNLPVRMTLYGWNKEITGIYEYRDIKLNIGTDDQEFKKLAHKRLQRLYLPMSQKTMKSQNFSSRTSAGGAERGPQKAQ